MQVSSLKYEVDTRKKTAKDLEAKLVGMERRHWEAAGRAEDTKKDLERKHVDKVVENESLKKTVENLERKVSLKIQMSMIYFRGGLSDLEVMAVGRS